MTFRRNDPASPALSSVLLAALLCCAAPLSAGAQEAEAITPSAEAEIALRCGVAFGLTGERLAAAEDSAGAEAYAAKAAVALERAAAELVPAGMSVEAFGALAETYVAELTAPFRATLLSEAECEAVID